MKRRNILIIAFIFLVFIAFSIPCYSQQSGFWGGGVSKPQLASDDEGFGADLIGVYNWVSTKLGAFFRGKYVVKQISGDHGNSGTVGTLAYVINQIGSDKATIILTGEYDYQISTDLTVPDNITLKFDEGARLDPDSGIDIDFDSDAQIIAGSRQQVKTGSGSISFARPSTVHANWWQENTTPGTTDMTDAIEAALASLPDAGGCVKIHDKNLATNEISVPPLVDIEGDQKAFPRIGSAYSITPIGSEIYFNGCDGLTYSAPTGSGFSYIRNLKISGDTGDYIGLDILSYDVSTENVGIYGFLTGVGMKLTNHWRTPHSNLNIQGCGLGLWLYDEVNAVHFDSPVIENCAVGIYGDDNCDGLVFTNPIVEGCEEGLLSTAFPGTGLITASSTILTDLGVAQDALEGGIMFAGWNAVFNGLYMEQCSLCIIYAGLGSTLTIDGGYMNDQITLTGSNQVAPDHFIMGPDARSIFYTNGRIKTSNSRSEALFDINSDRFHMIKPGWWVHTDGTLYTGTVYEDSTNTSVEYLSNAMLWDASGVWLGKKSYMTGLRSQNVTSSSNAITIDCQSGTVVFVDTLDENTTINTTNEEDGMYLEIHVFQDATGGRTVAWNSKFYGSWSDTGNTSNKKTCITWRYRDSQSRWYQIGEQVTYH